MKKDHWIIYLLFYCGPMHLFGQTFPCDGSLLLSTNHDGLPHITSKINFGPYGTLFFGLIESYQDVQFDALGFNSFDNYIYGVKVGSNQFAKLKSDGTYDIVGQFSELDTLNVTAGDCTPTGEFVCLENDLDQILVFDVEDDFSLIERLSLYWNENSQFSGPFTMKLGDFVINPNNPGFAYAITENYNHVDLQPEAARAWLILINLNFSDPNVGMVTPLKPLLNREMVKIGSLFSSGGQLFGYGSIDLGVKKEQYTLFGLNPGTGVVTKYNARGPTALISDGCSCPYTLSFVCDVSVRDVLCTRSSLTYTYTIFNRFYASIDSATFVNTLPPGMIITKIFGDFPGEMDLQAGVGTGVLHINQFTIPARGYISFEVTVDINDIPIDFVENQAFLTGLPERFGGVLPSDDPQTPGFAGDPTTIIGVAQSFDEFEVDVVHPTDCLNADNGVVTISSPQLIPGKNYDVVLRNQQWKTWNWKFNIGDSRSFTLEHLPPDEYTLAEVRLEGSNCSFAIEDRTIDVVAPNHLLEVEASINSPICENTPLVIEASAAPAGEVEWRGPYFLSDTLNHYFPEAENRLSGTYTLEVAYGACQQERIIEVEVVPAVSAIITGKSAYCEREYIKLNAKGEGNIESVEWMMANGHRRNTAELELAEMTADKKGIYQAIVSNGLCTDTATIELTMLPSPTIASEERIMIDLCGSLRLRPEIIGDNNISYSWNDTGGLSCYDCPSPEIILPLQSTYDLMVVNHYMCTDTASLQVSLDRRNLIHLPNAFSPNKDGLNDVFHLHPGCSVWKVQRLDIFNRWGSLIYSQEGLEENSRYGWDGKTNGIQITAGVYTYRIVVKLKDGSTEQIFGDITLLP